MQNVVSGRGRFLNLALSYNVPNRGEKVYLMIEYLRAVWFYIQNSIIICCKNRYLFQNLQLYETSIFKTSLL